MGSQVHDERGALLPRVASDEQEPTAKCQLALQWRRTELLGLELVALSAVCFSVVTTLVKLETMHGLTAMEALFWRSIVAFVLNWVCMTSRGVRTTVPPAERGFLLAQCVCGFCCIGFGFFAISRMVLADATVIIFTSPVLTFFLGAWLLDEPIDRVNLGCAWLSTLGLVCVVRPRFLFNSGQSDPDDNDLVGIIAAALAAVSQAMLYISVRKLQGMHSLIVAHYLALFCSGASLAFILIVYQRVHIPSSGAQWLAIAGTGVFAFIGQVALTKGFQLEHAGVAAVMRYLDVVCVFVWDSFLLNEPTNPWSLVGASVICLSASVITVRKAQLS